MKGFGDAWKGRTVLLTGHTGFKGAWLSTWLSRMGATVVGFARAADDDSLFHIAGLGAALGRSLVHVEGDVQDLAALKRLVAQHRPDVVLHLAAQSLVRLSYSAPVETFATNVMGTAHVLEAARVVDDKDVAVVVVTTDKVYENKEWPWAYREVDALGGHDPYSASKAAAELVTASYRKALLSTSRLQVASARAGNVIGGGDFAKDRVVPDLVRAAVAGGRTPIRSPGAVRPWQHVLEPLAGYLTLAERLLGHAGAAPDVKDAWNFGPRDEDAVPVLRLATRFVDQLGAGGFDVVPDPNAPKETHLLRVDSTKARQKLGWRPLLAVDEAVDLTAAWYRAWMRDPQSAFATLAAQIDAYQARLESHA